MIIDNFEDLIIELDNEKPRVIVLEGPRCSGKDKILKGILDELYYYDSYECAKPRKQWADSTGSVKKLNKFLDISQSTFWVFDFLNQVKDIFLIFNRSVPSNAYYDVDHAEEKLRLYDEWMEKLGGITLHIENSVQDYVTFIEKEGRVSEISLAFSERQGIKENISKLNRHQVITYINKIIK